ncbi:MAG: bifunctional diaminohydroxyphosphoribosylaminopyrimidine deaminase/5-amino-6-(5-phosphoribosylamino)uracil reductase RibD [Pirellulaceae bacterium]|nr:bifunctional diaminohydroxyphosphoribosylaminopyrimidine deaminase/5-amino-6-(5-phosphoribosylamino)uracil reductase RibD [Planctomycetales bacterium]
MREEAEIDRQWMSRAIQLAARGRGLVEPNPMVGAVLVRDGQLLGAAWHEAFGGPHAEALALQKAEDTSGATLYVTLEPCCHHGKTPPCTDAILHAGIARVVVASVDPFPEVAGKGIEQLRAGGLQVDVGLLADQEQFLNAPYRTLVIHRRPWIIAKWAMTLDGRIATSTGDSQWISNEEARIRVHQLRGRMDGVAIGVGTVLRDDPLLTARPPGPRQAQRIVFDSQGRMPTSVQLLRSNKVTSASPGVLVVVGPKVNQDHCSRLHDAGAEVFQCHAHSYVDRISEILQELGRRRLTNLLVEGGADVLGAFWDAKLIDEVHVFIAPKLVGGQQCVPAVGGTGIASIVDAGHLQHTQIELLDDNVYYCGRIAR